MSIVQLGSSNNNKIAHSHVETYAINIVCAAAVKEIENEKHYGKKSWKKLFFGIIA